MYRSCQVMLLLVIPMLKSTNPTSFYGMGFDPVGVSKVIPPTNQTLTIESCSFVCEGNLIQIDASKESKVHFKDVTLIFKGAFGPLTEEQDYELLLLYLEGKGEEYEWPLNYKRVIDDKIYSSPMRFTYDER